MKSWKKVVSAVLCAGLLLFGYSFPAQINAPSAPVYLGQAGAPGSVSPPQEDAADYVTAVSDFSVYAGGYGYWRQLNGFNHLETDELRKCYRVLLNNAYQISDKKNVDGHYQVKKAVLEGIALSKSQVLEVVTALRNDNPQLFWVMNDLRYGVSNGDTVVQLCSYFPGSQIQQEIARLEKAVKGILKELPGELPEFERELFLHDTIIGTVEYGDAAELDPASDPMAFTVYGALVNGRGVCEGYSRAMQLLASCVGLQCNLVTGTSEGVAHMWNVIQIDGDWYHLDLTWDDTASINSYQYFNLTDDQIAVNHSLDPIFCSAGGLGEWQQPLYNLYVPICDSPEGNYYRQKAIWIGSMDGSSDQVAMDAIVHAVLRGEPTISYQFSTAVDFDLAVAMLLTQEPYKFSYYVRCANDFFGEERVRESGIQYVVDKNQRAVTIQLLAP